MRKSLGEPFHILAGYRCGTGFDEIYPVSNCTQFLIREFHYQTKACRYHEGCNLVVWQLENIKESIDILQAVQNAHCASSNQHRMNFE